MAQVYEQCKPRVKFQDNEPAGPLGDTKSLRENIDSNMHTASTAAPQTTETTLHDGASGRPTLERARYLRDIVRIRHSSGKSVWCNKRSNLWFDETSEIWRTFLDPASRCNGGTLQLKPHNTEISVSTSPAASEVTPIDYRQLAQKKSILSQGKSLFSSVRNTLVNRLQKQQNNMLRIHISHLGSPGQGDASCYTTHIVPTYKLVGHLFILHAMEGGVVPHSNIALVQTGVLNDRGEWEAADTKVKPLYWNPVDETSVMDAGWHFCGNELWLALIST